MILRVMIALALVVGSVNLPACGEDDKEVDCAPGLSKVGLPSSCQVLLEDKVCACKPLPARVTEGDCHLAEHGKVCVTPSEETDLTEENCKLGLDMLSTGRFDVCEMAEVFLTRYRHGSLPKRHMLPPCGVLTEKHAGNAGRENGFLKC